MALIRHAQADRIARDAIVLDLGDVQRQAAQLMEQARRRAEEIVAGARVERERLIAGAAAQGRAEGAARGQEEGRKAGAEQGKTAALNEWRSKLTEVEKKWGEALRLFEAERERMLSEARTDLVRLAVRIAEKVVKCTIEANPAVAAAQLEAVLALVARPTELIIAIHPLDREGVQAALPALMARFQSVRHVELNDAPELARGSCVARTRAQGESGSAGGGEIDASIDEQLRRMSELLLPRTPGGGA